MARVVENDSAREGEEEEDISNIEAIKNVDR